MVADQNTVAIIRETRSQAAKRLKRCAPDQECIPESHGDTRQLNVSIRDDEVYTPGLSLLQFVYLSGLDTSPDTDQLTLNLINLTLAQDHWHPGLSGMLQPASCFLVASLLTHRQNLVEDIAASVQVFGIEYEELMGGYRLLWEWRERLKAVVGRHDEVLSNLPDPSLLL